MDDKWQPIETAPDGDRVLVCGWTHGNRMKGWRKGYWWWCEDVVHDGKGTEHPDALYWCPIVLPPFPAPPELKGE